MKIFKIIFFLATAFCFCLQYFGRILWGHKPIMNTNIDSAGDRRFGKRGDRRRRPPRKVRASSSFWRETFRSDTKFGRARTNVLCFFWFWRGGGREDGRQVDHFIFRRGRYGGPEQWPIGANSSQTERHGTHQRQKVGAGGSRRSGSRRIWTGCRLICKKNTEQRNGTGMNNRKERERHTNTDTHSTNEN